MSSPASKRVCMGALQASTSSFTTDDNPLLTKVHPNGDVILRVGEDEGVLFILASSGVLVAASGFFEHLFSVHLTKKDLASSSINPKEIPMEEDNPQAMLDLCKILHHRSDEVKVNDSRTTIELAAVCCKYDCYRPVKLWMLTQVREQFRLRRIRDRLPIL